MVVGVVVGSAALSNVASGLAVSSSNGVCMVALCGR